MIRRKYDSVEEVKQLEEYHQYIKLGYSEKQAVVLCLLNFDSYGDDQTFIQFYNDKHQKESFVDFVYENYFSFNPPEPPRDTTPKGKTYSSGNRGFGAAVSSFVGNVFGGARKETSHAYMAKTCKVVEPELECRAVMEEAVYAAPMVCRESTPFGVSIESVRTDSYETIEEKSQRDVSVSPTATFRPTYNTAAAGILLANIKNGSNTRHSMVRTEELLNYMNWTLNKAEGKKFEITKEYKEKNGKGYLFLGVQGEKILPTRQNICFLLDVSGSMSGRDAEMKASLLTTLAKMHDGDVFSLVTYSTNDKVVINGLVLNKEVDIDRIIEMLWKEVAITGCTNGSAGLNKAYEIVEHNLIKDGVNRVIIVTDGDLNFGISDKDGLVGLIKNKKKTGAYFSAIGTGIYNIQDDKLEALAKNGNGNYFVVNSLEDAKRTLDERYESLVYPIAKNVKAQVEFNPAKVKTWKLIGYENRMLNHEDFRNDAVIAEPFGSGSYFIALFEIEKTNGATDSSLKYQKAVVNDSDELATLTVRFEDVDDDTVKELEFAVESELPATENVERAITCSEIAEKLRKDNPDSLSKAELEKLLN